MTDELRKLPRVDRVVAHASLDAARRRLGEPAITRLARRAIADAREAVIRGAPAATLDAVAENVANAARATLTARARRVINATGVVLHTNLGRAPLATEVADAVRASAVGYTSLEIDLSTGRRGARGAFAEGALSDLAGAEAALVVNNNAAAVLLALTATAIGRGVIVSRGELVEIGGGFRVPDVLARSGARMIEVGTTNRTRVSDYAAALDDAKDCAAILRVHQGNFRQTGFVERPELSELSALARARGVLLVKDLGGGALVDLAPQGLTGEPLVRACIESGVDAVCFSTDKVIGGPQGGVIVGRADVVERARRDPLARALRIGRLPLVALEATLALYLERREADVPALFALRRPESEVRARAAAWQRTLESDSIASRVVDLEAVAGGGSFADEHVASFGIAFDLDAERFADALRANDPPIIARIHDGRVVLDARTVLPDEDAALLAGVAHAARALA
jgi:L-seryl-tRNA(Ser) seleniumtransferase